LLSSNDNAFSITKLKSRVMTEGGAVMSALSRVSVRRNLDFSSRWHCLTENVRGAGAFTAAAFALLAALFLVPVCADAAVTPPSLSMTVGISGTSLQVNPTLTPGSAPDTYFCDGSMSATSYTLNYSFNVNADPTVSGTFTLTNLTSQTMTFSVSATLSTLPLAGPTQVSASYGLGQLSAPVGTPEAHLTANPFFQALIDGSTVQTLGSNLSITTSGGTAPIPMQSFTNQPGPALSSSIGAAFPAFTLTGLDTVETPFSVTVVPEPASVALLVPGLAMVFIRRRAMPVRHDGAK
jgi:hypothetical protein